MPKFIVSAIEFFSGQTFGIYLIHILLMCLADVKFNFSPVNSLARFLYAVALFIISGLIIKLLQKIPLVKYIVP